MKADLLDVPFDHFQRYAAAAHLVKAVGASARSVLEIGANRQRLLAEFLPKHELLFSDLYPQDDLENFVVADATSLPFESRSYDAVISLDVMEHIPKDLRRIAAAEIARVSERLVVICCPLDREWVHDAEKKAHQIWKTYFSDPYPWLDEHEEFGLVDPQEIESALRAAGLHVIRFGQGDPNVWASLMGCHFVKEAFPDMAELVSSIDRYYNSAIFLGDRGENSYREFFVGLRHEADVIHLENAALLKAERDEPGTRYLAGLVDRLTPIAGRIRASEEEWSKTASLLVDCEERLRLEAQLHHETGLVLREQELSAVEQLHRADAADRKTLAVSEFLNDLSRSFEDLQSQSDALSSSLIAQTSRVGELELANGYLAGELEDSLATISKQGTEIERLAHELHLSVVDRSAAENRILAPDLRCERIKRHLKLSQAEQIATTVRCNSLRSEVLDAVSKNEEAQSKVSSLLQENVNLANGADRLMRRNAALERRQAFVVWLSAIVAVIAAAGYLISQ